MERKSYGKKRKERWVGGGGGFKRTFYGSSSSSSSKRILAPIAGPAPELKALDLEGSLSATSAGNFLLLNGCFPGAQSYQRIGRRVCLRSVLLRLNIRYSGNNNSFGGDLIRVFLVYDRQSNGAAPGLADVLQGQTNVGGNLVSSMSSLNINNTRRFLILRDWMCYKNQVIAYPDPAAVGASLLAQSSAADSVCETTQKWLIGKKVRNLVVQFNQNVNGDVTDIETGSLFLVVVGRNPSFNWSVDYSTRVRFCDL